jgi:hypothetical protein
VKFLMPARRQAPAKPVLDLAAGGLFLGIRFSRRRQKNLFGLWAAGLAQSLLAARLKHRQRGDDALVQRHAAGLSL